MIVSVFVVISHITFLLVAVALECNFLLLNERLCYRSSVTAKFAVGDVDFDVCVKLAWSCVDWAEVSVVNLFFDVELGVCVTLIRFTVAEDISN